MLVDFPRNNRRTMDRRQLLTASTLGLAGLAGGGLSAAPSPGGSGGQAKSTILIWLNGGPSHVDLWDMKPDAPVRSSRFPPQHRASACASICPTPPDRLTIWPWSGRWANTAAAPTTTMRAASTT